MNDFVMRAARTQDFAALVRIEIDAAGLFPADVLPVSARGVLTTEKLQAVLKYSCLWVAELVEGEVIGFILAEEYERSRHVKEMDVAPAYMRGGVGTHAGDTVGEIALAIEMGADAVDIGKTIHPHPTLGESIGMAAEAAHGSYTDLPPARK